ncbi:MAG: hypothetical protein DWI58_12180 [Chloroflexi bacterium]|nr:MAG: hypothetical protein DWI58_12180 [Chloroflexota bacterium]
MPNQYVASDTRTGLQVQVTGTFPEDPDDRVRIARTTNLFTRLMGTVLTTESDTERRERFRAIETQLEVAEALIRGDMAEVQRLVRDTLHNMGVTEDQLREVETQLREQMARLGQDMPPEFGSMFGGLGGPAPDAPPADTPDPRYPDDPPPAPKP